MGAMKKRIKASFQALLRRTSPIVFLDQGVRRPVSASFGFDRGTPIDRWYIEKFLSRHVRSIRGRCIEVGEVKYLNLPGAHADTKVVLAVKRTAAKSNGGKVLVADLTQLASLPEAAFDCFVCTQTLNFIFDVRAAIAGAHRLLDKGGCFLGTVAGISQVSRRDMEKWGDYWRFTNLSLQRLLAEQFGDGATVQSFGNVRAAQLLLDGIAVEDLPDCSILDDTDDCYPVTLGFVATRS
jgi:hypothetical protein